MATKEEMGRILQRKLLEQEFGRDQHQKPEPYSQTEILKRAMAEYRERQAHQGGN